MARRLIERDLLSPHHRRPPWSELSFRVGLSRTARPGPRPNMHQADGEMRVTARAVPGPSEHGGQRPGSRNESGTARSSARQLNTRSESRATSVGTSRVGSAGANGTAIPSAARHGRAARRRLQRGSLRNLQAPRATRAHPGQGDPDPPCARTEQGAPSVVRRAVRPRREPVEVRPTRCRRWPGTRSVPSCGQEGLLGVEGRRPPLCSTGGVPGRLVHPMA